MIDDVPELRDLDGIRKMFAADLAPTIRGIQADGVSTLGGIAEELNRCGILTPTGKGKWKAMQVRRVMARLK